MNFLSTIRDHTNSKKFNVTFIQKEEDNTNNFTKIWTELHGDTSNPKVGSFLKDVNKGSVVDEFFKSHNSYEPTISTSKLRNCTENCKSTLKSEVKSRPKTSKIYSGSSRLEKQCKDYHDKAALLNEINYNKPLV